MYPVLGDELDEDHAAHRQDDQDEDGGPRRSAASQ